MEKIADILGGFKLKPKLMRMPDRSLVAWDGAHFFIPNSILEEFRRAYPFFGREIIKAELWYLANPRRRKKNHFRFLVNWMSRARK